MAWPHVIAAPGVDWRHSLRARGSTLSPAPTHFETVATLARRLRSGELTAVALVEMFLDRIAALDPKLGAFRLVLRERALAQARAAQIALQAGIDLGPLQGQPWVAKDLFDVKGHPTTAGTHLLAGAIAQEDS